jgi:glutamate 5-kinase
MNNHLWLMAVAPDYQFNYSLVSYPVMSVLEVGHFRDEMGVHCMRQADLDFHEISKGTVPQELSLNVMLDNGVLPIVNENDTVSITGLMFTDNDELSGLIAQMMQAETLVLLSNIDGVFTKNPNDPTAELIPEVQPGRDLSEYIQPEKSAFGRGGMHSKYTTATKVQKAGIRVIIANGERDNILVDLMQNKLNVPHTEFIPYGID